MSISVKVMFLANFREIVGKKEIVEEVAPDSTLRHILEKLASKYGRDFRQIVDGKTGKISSEFLVSINGQIMRDTSVKLNNDDTLMLSIVASGG